MEESTCLECGKRYANKYVLQRHLQSTSCGGDETETYECSRCVFVTHSRDTYNKHDPKCKLHSAKLLSQIDEIEMELNRAKGDLEYEREVSDTLRANIESREEKDVALATTIKELKAKLKRRKSTIKTLTSQLNSQRQTNAIVSAKLEVYERSTQNLSREVSPVVTKNGSGVKKSIFADIPEEHDSD